MACTTALPCSNLGSCNTRHAQHATVMLSIAYHSAHLGTAGRTCVAWYAACLPGYSILQLHARGMRNTAMLHAVLVCT